MAQLITESLPWQQMLLAVINRKQNENTRQTYFSALRKFFDWYHHSGHTRLQADTFSEYLLYLESAGASRSTIATHLSALRLLAAEVRDRGLIDRDTHTSLTELKIKRQRGRRRGEWLSLAEVQRLLAGIEPYRTKDVRDRAIVALLIGTGLRRFELASLIPGQITQLEGRRVIANIIGKGDRYRTIPIPEWACRCLDAWLELRGTLNNNPTAHLFFSLTRSGKPRAATLTSQAIRNIVRERCQTILGHARLPHDLRRTYAKLAYEAGAPLAQVQIALGHSSIRTTEIYLGLDQDFQQSPGDYIAVELM